MLFIFKYNVCVLVLFMAKYSQQTLPCRVWKGPIHDKQRYLQMFGNFSNCNKESIHFVVRDCKGKIMDSKQFEPRYGTGNHISYLSRGNDLSDLHTFSSFEISLTKTDKPQNCILNHVAAQNGDQALGVFCQYSLNDFCIRLDNSEPKATFDLNCFYNEGMCDLGDVRATCTKEPAKKNCIEGGNHPPPLPKRYKIKESGAGIKPGGSFKQPDTVLIFAMIYQLLAVLYKQF